MTHRDASRSDDALPDDELLQALVVGDLTASDPIVTVRFDENPELAARWHELSGTLQEVGLLRGIGDMLTSDGQEDVPFDVAAVVRRFRDDESPASDPQAGQSHAAQPTGRRWTGPRWVAAAAAAMLITAWALGWFDSRDRSQRLGGGGIELVPDGSAIAVGTPLTWGTAPDAAYYRIELEAIDGPAQPLTFDDLEQPRWQPTIEQHQQLPLRFRWRVIGYDASGEALFTSHWAQSSRR